MTIHTSSTRSKTELALPDNPNGPSGFGDGFRFHYNNGTHQSSWSEKQYRFYSDTKNEPDEAREQRAAVFAHKPANDEKTLSVYDRLCFACEISIRYHTRRHQHYERLSRLITGSVILLSAFAFVSGVDSRVTLGMTIMGLAAGSFVWNIHSQSRLHDVLRNDYQTLLEQIRMTPEPTELDLRKWRTMRLRIQSREPPVFWAVANDCYYDVARAWDLEPQRRGRLPAMLRPFMNWFRF